MVWIHSRVFYVNLVLKRLITQNCVAGVWLDLVMIFYPLVLMQFHPKCCFSMTEEQWSHSTRSISNQLTSVSIEQLLMPK